MKALPKARYWELVVQSRSVNDYICRHLRRLRKARGISSASMARRLGLPRSSYCSVETGAYQIKADLLDQALQILNADIVDVWPLPDSIAALDDRRQLLRMHQFRLGELVSITGARGGLLLSLVRSSVQVHLSSHLSDSKIERIVQYTKSDQLMAPGFWFRRNLGHSKFLLYLDVEQEPMRSRFLIEHYLVVWASFFAHS